jgi:hypothetical protein
VNWLRINAIEMTKAHEMKDGYLASESPYQTDPTLPAGQKDSGWGGLLRLDHPVRTFEFGC